MKIGIDATTWWNKRGFGRFTRQLLGAMFKHPREHEYCLFVDRPAAKEMERDNVSVVVVNSSRTVTEAAVADGSRSIVDLMAFRKAARAEGLDAFYFPAVYSWFPIARNIPSVITFHDAIAEHFPDLVMPRWRNRMLWNAKVWLAKTSASAITTVSEAARRELVGYLGLAESEIDVIHEAADPAFKPVRDDNLLKDIRKRLSLPLERRFFLYVGGLAPHKNLAGLVEAFEIARSRGTLDDVDLVLAGDPKGDGFHSNYEELVAKVEKSPELQGRVHFPGFVADEILPGLYSDALAVLMPAFSEGFGLPAAEAVACGTPVLATEGGSVAEFVGSAGIYFDPYSVEEMASALTRIATDPALESGLRSNCIKQAAALSWDRAAEETLDVIERAGRRG